MRSDVLERAVQDAVAMLAGSTLIDIRVGVFVVDFVFLGDNLTIIVRITKRFEFSIAKDKPKSFDPSLESHDLLVESSEFLFLRGLRSRGASLNLTRFEVAFDSDARLWIDLVPKDFEPLELIGATGERHEKLAFHHVL